MCEKTPSPPSLSVLIGESERYAGGGYLRYGRGGKSWIFRDCSDPGGSGRNLRKARMRKFGEPRCTVELVNQGQGSPRWTPSIVDRRSTEGRPLRICKDQNLAPIVQPLSLVYIDLYIKVNGGR